MTVRTMRLRADLKMVRLATHFRAKKSSAPQSRKPHEFSKHLVCANKPMSFGTLEVRGSKSVDYEAVCGSTVVLHIFSVFVSPFHYA
jgi:hypothetical protein